MMNLLNYPDPMREALVIGLWLAVQLSSPAQSLAQPLGPGASDRLRSFSTEDNPSALERVRDGLEPGSRDWVEATRRLADTHATTCFESDEDNPPDCQRAAELYQEALDSGTTIARLDELLYQAGLLESWLGNGEGAVALWQRLMSELHDSNLYPFAALALGEHYFASAMLEPAREMLRTAAAAPDFNGRYYALYLDAWCAVNLSDYADSLDLMADAVRAVERDMPQDETMRAQMLRDLPMIFAAGGNPAEALTFFNGVAPTEAAALVAQTAALLRELGRAEDADVVQALVPQEVLVPQNLVTSRPRDPPPKHILVLFAIL